MLDTKTSPNVLDLGGAPEHHELRDPEQTDCYEEETGQLLSACDSRDANPSAGARPLRADLRERPDLQGAAEGAATGLKSARTGPIGLR